MCRSNRVDNNKRYNRDRRRHSSTRESEEKDRDRNERRNRSSLHYSSHSASFTRDRSRSRYRSRSRSPISERGRERKRDFNEISKCSYFSSSNSIRSSYMRLPRPMLMPRVPPLPMLMHVFPRPVLPMPFPPMNLYHQPYLGFVNGRGIPW
ncbi:PREDICTED: serine/threonine-protein kinase fray2-like [Trachymyrmex cornetzi]|uniref:serine/threonine-protein kinase fray2-like n=1 Tax=Trachymyrmex cornetzi TaxID=471704 RepID=UPI00084EDEB4|nr:PREDICTED: serine/threonine-protein kinase fray2-like [Trachymyrmex cornetzi]